MDSAYKADGKAMADSVLELYEEAHRVVCTHARLNSLAMAAMQSMGFNGFKRWHRSRSKELHCLDLELANEFIDRFRLKASPKAYELSYGPSGMEGHLEAWEKALLEGMQVLGSAGKEHYRLSGMESRAVRESLEILAKDYEKVGRLLARFRESDWLSLDLHTVDDRLHEKFKRKERADGGC